MLISTDLFSRGIDIARVNLVVNYDMPLDSNNYLHRVGRAGRYNTEGISVSFVNNEADEKVLKDVQARFEIKIQELPQKIDDNTFKN